MSGTIHLSVPVLAIVLVAAINASLLVLGVLVMVLTAGISDAHFYWRWQRPFHAGYTVWQFTKDRFRKWARPLIWLVIVIYGWFRAKSLFREFELSKYRERVSR